MLTRMANLFTGRIRPGRPLLALLILTLLVTACQDDARRNEPNNNGGASMVIPTLEKNVTIDEPRPDAPPYALRGSFAVGYRVFEKAVDDDERPAVHAWYPAEGDSVTSQQITYEVAYKDTTWQPEIEPVVLGSAVRDAKPAEHQNSFPLVILSHSFTGSAAGYSSLAEHYASHGFIVLAPEHDEQFDETMSDFWKALIDRPADVTRTLDFAEELTGPRGTLAGLIDMEQVAVVGHSYGGYTALAMAGARIDLNAFNERCDRVAADHPSAFICAALVPNEEAMAERAGIDPTSTDLWPSFGDPRVKAIVPMAGDAYLFDSAGLAYVTVPMMAMGGTADFGTPYDWGAQLAYERATSERKSLVGLTGAEHMIFATPCKLQPWMTEHPAYGYFCFDPVWDIDRAQDLIHHLSTAFLLDVLVNDPDARVALGPDAAQFPGIEYTTTVD